MKTVKKLRIFTQAQKWNVKVFVLYLSIFIFCYFLLPLCYILGSSHFLLHYIYFMTWVISYFSSTSSNHVMWKWPHLTGVPSSLVQAGTDHVAGDRSVRSVTLSVGHDGNAHLLQRLREGKRNCRGTRRQCGTSWQLHHCLSRCHRSIWCLITWRQAVGLLSWRA